MDPAIDLDNSLYDDSDSFQFLLYSQPPTDEPNFTIYSHRFSDLVVQLIPCQKPEMEIHIIESYSHLLS